MVNPSIQPRSFFFSLVCLSFWRFNENVVRILTFFKHARRLRTEYQSSARTFSTDAIRRFLVGNMTPQEAVLSRCRSSAGTRWGSRLCRGRRRSLECRLPWTLLATGSAGPTSKFATENGFLDHKSFPLSTQSI